MLEKVTYKIIVRRFCILIPLICFVFANGCSTGYILKSPKYAEYEGEINQHRRFIRAEKSRIFGILTHEDAFRTICPKGTVVTHKSPPPYQVGTLVQTRIDHIFKLVWHSRVDEFISDKKIRLKFLDGFFANGTELWELGTMEGGTEIKHTIIVRPEGILKKLAWHLKVRLKHDRMLEAMLDNLKRKAETE
jgi:hypothetical protein